MRDQLAVVNSDRRSTLSAIERFPQTAPSSVPAPLTRLIGRDAERAALQRALGDDEVRLLTVTGPGGTGKSRLALAVADDVAHRYPDGAAFVDLSPLTDPALVLPTIAKTVGVRESVDRQILAGLTRFLATKRTLLLLDNFERVVEAAPDVAALLVACRGLTVLVTSRELLHVRGEHEFSLPPLDVPALDRLPERDELAAMPAVALFVERAKASRPDFALTDGNAATVAAICHRLDGSPLAIELAAARIKVLPPTALLARLETRLPVLTGGARDLPARQRTMRDSVAWSYDLLSPAERAFFRRLSIFAGGFALEAAERAAGGELEGGIPEAVTLDLLTSLVDKGLLRRVQGTGDEARFAMLETIREYGLERLQAEGELDDAQRRHAAYFLAFAERAESRLRGPEQGAYRKLLETEHDNLRAALAWSLAAPEGVEQALRLAGTLHWFWYLSGHAREALRWLEAALTASSNAAPSSARTKALAGAGLFAFHLSDYPLARDLVREGVATGRTLGDLSGVAYALHVLAFGDLLQRDHAELRAIAEESVSLFRQAGDRWGIAKSLCTLGMVCIVGRDPAAAGPLRESLALARELGDTWGIARALHYAGEVARFLGNDDEARSLYEESLPLYRDLDDRSSAAIVLDDLGYVATHQGDPRRGLSSFLEALAEHAQAGDRQLIAHSLAGAAGMATVLDRPMQAARLFGASAAICERIGAAIWPVEKVDHDRHLADTRVRLGEGEFTAAFAAGRELAPEDAIAEAFALGDEITARTRAGRMPATARAPANPFGLSPREREVLLLLTRHATDREIADALSISPRTVMHHVSSILAKLGVDNRRHAAILAANRDVV
jgi:predicted ATPase/DNA-binding CsgD family transcriptional regulator